MSRCALQVTANAGHLVPLSPAGSGVARSEEYENGTRAKLPATPNAAPMSSCFSSDTRYWRLVAFPKFHVLPVTPSLTVFALKPPIPADIHTSGSLVAY